MFSKISYPEIVAEARAIAQETKCKTVIYQQGRWFPKYDWTFITNWDAVLRLSKRPIIRLLICMPNGTVVQ